MTVGNPPVGWTDTTANDSFAEVVNNPSASGINTSTRVLGFTDTGFTNSITSEAIDITGFNPGTYTYTLSFDAYSAGTTVHAGIFGLKSGTSSQIYWLGSSTGRLRAGDANLDFDFAVANTWENFNFNITSGVSVYLTNLKGDGAQSPSDFRLVFQSWDETTNPPITYFDNVSLTVVPEPSTYAMLFGVLALVFALVRRRLGRTNS